MGTNRCTLRDLQKRYLADLDVLERWLTFLQIEVFPSSDGVVANAEVDDRDLATLDALHRHLVAGGSLDNFPGSMLPDLVPHQELTPNPGDSLQVPPQQALASRSAIIPTSSYALEEEGEFLSIPQMRQRFEFLDDCAARVWLLTTGQVCSITGLKSSTLLARAKSAGECRWQSWSFSRAGRQGRESLWKVSSPRISSSVAIEVANAKPRVSPRN